MSMDTDMRARHGRVLAELAEAGMVMARQLSVAMLEATDVRTQAQLGLAFHRVSRTVRQTLALEFRLAQEARREDRPQPARALSEPAPQPPSTQATVPRPPRERTGWDEYESDDSDEALDELDALLEAGQADPATVDAAVETCIAYLRNNLEREATLPLQGRASPVMRPSGGHPPGSGRLAGRNPPAPMRDTSPGIVPRSRSALLGGAALPRPPPGPWRSSA